MCELIDTQWNVNKYNILFSKLNGWELIDTQWNVNDEGPLRNYEEWMELIDTQWNVNRNVTTYVNWLEEN